MAGITDASAPLDTQALRRLGTSSYLFLALDDISQKARGTSLFAVLPDTNDNSEPRGTDAAGQ
jgi:putative ATP-dependent endonuclease of OLD family